MAAWLKYINNSTRYGEFFIDAEEDLALLPNLTNAGQDSLSTVNGVSQGSKAILTNTDAKYYRLSGNNVWVEVTTSGGGGGGGTTDYNALANKPSINGVELSGNKTSDDIDVAPESRVEGEQLIFDQNQFGFGI